MALKSKTCCRCGDAHFLHEGYFYKDSNSKDGFKAACIQCQWERGEELRLEKEKTLEVVNNNDNLVVTGEQVAKMASVSVEDWVSNGGQINKIPYVGKSINGKGRKKMKRSGFNPNSQEVKKNVWLVDSTKEILESRGFSDVIQKITNTNLPDLQSIGKEGDSFVKCRFVTAPTFFKRNQTYQVSINAEQFVKYQKQCEDSQSRYFYAFYIANEEKLYFIDIRRLCQIGVDHSNLETDINNKLETDNELWFYDIKLIKHHANLVENLSRPFGMIMTKDADGKIKGHLNSKVIGEEPSSQLPF